MVLLSQLTSAGPLSLDEFLDRFHLIKHQQTQYIVVIEQVSKPGKVIELSDFSIKKYMYIFDIGKKKLIFFPLYFLPFLPVFLKVIFVIFARLKIVTLSIPILSILKLRFFFFLFFSIV